MIKHHTLEFAKSELNLLKIWNDNILNYIKDTQKGIVNADSKRVKDNL